MLQTVRSFQGAVTAPHHLASRAGLRVLQEGGNAIEAMIAAASTIGVVYPHMNGIGGDNFWLIHNPGQNVIGIDACGGAADLADIPFYLEQGVPAIPDRGPQAALTTAGAVSGWQAALDISSNEWGGGRLPLSRLLEDAVFYAGDGVAVTRTLADNTAAKLDQLKNIPGFAEAFLTGGAPIQLGARLRQPRLAATLAHLAGKGLEDFYRGELARAVADDLERTGSPLRLPDLERHRALRVAPLSVEVSGHTVYNLPPPTQGLASLILLGVFNRLNVGADGGFDFVHNLVESTKCAFRVRDRHITDPRYMQTAAESYLTPDSLAVMASGIAPDRASPWPDAAPGGDTVWLSAVDGAGRSVSFIQSIYWEFGSGVVLENSGITWQNRGVSFSLEPTHHNCLIPRRRPFHTIQPALAHLKDGRVMAYGTMGGEGQPQTQAMLFARHALLGQDLQQAVTAPRWLLGRTWGDDATSLRLENRFDADLYTRLRAAGHRVDVVGPYEEIMGHAGSLVRHPNGLIEGATDPRSDGAVAAY